MTTRNWNQAAWAQLRSLPNNKPLQPVGERLEVSGANSRGRLMSGDETCVDCRYHVCNCEAHAPQNPTVGTFTWAIEQLDAGKTIRCSECYCNGRSPDVGIEWRKHSKGGREWRKPGGEWEASAALLYPSDWNTHGFDVVVVVVEVESEKPAAHSGELDWAQAKSAMLDGRSVRIDPHGFSPDLDKVFSYDQATAKFIYTYVDTGKRDWSATFNRSTPTPLHYLVVAP